MVQKLGDGDRLLSRRERQIMEILHRRGQATVAEVRQSMPDSPSYSAVRALIGILERKGHLRHRKDGLRYVYRPTRSRQTAARSALRRLLETYFDGSTGQAVAALLDAATDELSPAELDRLQAMIEAARTEGR
ncbi:MAG: BlaI/MecI/CopY family transcriptional regulator [Thermoanaerobaculia bacterium]